MGDEIYHRFWKTKQKPCLSNLVAEIKVIIAGNCYQRDSLTLWQPKATKFMLIIIRKGKGQNMILFNFCYMPIALYVCIYLQLSSISKRGPWGGVNRASLQIRKLRT